MQSNERANAAYHQCLVKILNVSKHFLAKLQEDCDFLEALEEYEKKREILFKALSYYQKDTSLDKALTYSPEIKNLLSQIIELDQTVLEAIETEKSNLSKELSHSKKNKDQLNRFKSEWISPSGKRLDGKA